MKKYLIFHFIILQFTTHFLQSQERKLAILISSTDYKFYNFNKTIDAQTHYYYDTLDRLSKSILKKDYGEGTIERCLDVVYTSDGKVEHYTYNSTNELKYSISKTIYDNRYRLLHNSSGHCINDTCEYDYEHDKLKYTEREDGLVEFINQSIFEYGVLSDTALFSVKYDTNDNILGYKYNTYNLSGNRRNIERQVVFNYKPSENIPYEILRGTTERYEIRKNEFERISEIKRFEGRYLTEVSKYTYDKNGMTKLHTKYTKEGKARWVSEFQFDKNGYLLEFVKRNEFTKRQYKTEYVYNKKLRLVPPYPFTGVPPLYEVPYRIFLRINRYLNIFNQTVALDYPVTKMTSYEKNLGVFLKKSEVEYKYRILED